MIVLSDPSQYKWFHTNNFLTEPFALDGTLNGTTIPGQSGPRSNGNEEVVHTPQSSRIGALALDADVSYSGLFGMVGCLTPPKRMQSTYSKLRW